MQNKWGVAIERVMDLSDLAVSHWMVENSYIYWARHGFVGHRLVPLIKGFEWFENSHVSDKLWCLPHNGVADTIVYQEHSTNWEDYRFELFENVNLLSMSWIWGTQVCPTLTIVVTNTVKRKFPGIKIKKEEAILWKIRTTGIGDNHKAGKLNFLCRLVQWNLYKATTKICFTLDNCSLTTVSIEMIM